jgi:hypothetical protein
MVYKIYPASQYSSLDLSLYQDNIRWSLDGTQFIVEFKEKPHGNTITLTREEARQIMVTPEWTDYSDFGATF